MKNLALLYQITGFELLEEDLSALFTEYLKESRQVTSDNKVFPTKRQNQSIPGRNVLIFVYIVANICALSWR